jgi:hypothetical protein
MFSVVFAVQASCKDIESGALKFQFLKRKYYEET